LFPKQRIFQFLDENIIIIIIHALSILNAIYPSLILSSTLHGGGTASIAA
jgi:hypothetical protein